jgi:acyl CoA:acetate/3-ketoacid CoA transferase beta subunit
VVITELGVFRCVDGRLVLEELAPDTTLDELRAGTEATFAVSRALTTMHGP